ncbi:MAG: MoxR family ATPase [Planctomycetaceae bacterium]|nr:MoxR family ATPase [Planctomycetaceae bacterium]
MAQESNSGDFAAQVEAFGADYNRIAESIATVIVGHQQVVHDVLTCLLCGGHALLEGVPGLGKTLLVRTLGQALEMSFSRIQFTPDLMPADITGTNVVVEAPGGGKAFQFHPGPIFANLVLADEINRATPKTQSAVLEAMQEKTVSISRTTHALPRPFLVMATQNPLEMEGTYPLPEAQLDRFMLKIRVESPSAKELAAIIARTTGEETAPAPRAADAAGIIAMQQLVRQVPVATHVNGYVARLVLATDPRNDAASPDTKKYIRYGASPRGAQSIVMASKVLALRDGRANVALDDIKSVAVAALRHRIILSFEGQADGIDTDDLIAKVVASVPSAAQE